MTRAFDIVITDEAQGDLDEIKDTRTYGAIERKIGGLALEPDRQGKPLGRNLGDYRAVRAAGQRYRVVYQVGMLEGVVTVVVVGIRKAGNKRDAYRMASKRLGGK